MKKRVKDAKSLSKELNEGSINRNYFYPVRLLKQIVREYNRKSLKPEESGPSLIERGIDSIQDLLSDVPQQEEQRNKQLIYKHHLYQIHHNQWYKQRGILTQQQA